MMTNLKLCYRNALVADPGKKLVEFDLKQAEAMIVAWLSKDETLKKAFLTGEDIHSLTGAMLFGLDYSWVVKNKKTDKKAKLARQTAKPVNHGYNYSMGPKALQKNMDKFGLTYSLADCKDFLRKMTVLRPAVQQWHASIREQLQKTRTLVTPLGYKRIFLGKLTDQVFRTAYAFIPQSTVGHLLVKVWNRIDQKYPEEVDCLLNVHDSLVIQYPDGLSKDQEDEVLHKLAKEFLIPLSINGSTLTVPVEAKIGYRFGDMEDYVLDEERLAA